MEITVNEFEQAELITIKGRVDSVQAARLAQALGAAHHRGRYKIIMDMSQLEYMSSAGFRALGDAQRNSQRHTGGQVMLAQVPGHIHEALEMVGFLEYFRIFDTVASALEYLSNLPVGNSPVDVPPSSF